MSARVSLLSLALFTFGTCACRCEPELPPVPRIERLTFEGTLPEGFSLDGIAVIRATKKTRECFGTIEWLWRHTGGGDAQGYPRRTVKPEFEPLQGGRYRLHYRFDEHVVGGPCRWQLAEMEVSAKWGPEANGFMIVYQPERALDPPTELWMGPAKEAIRPLKIACLYVSHGEVSELCQYRIADDSIPMFEGTLTIPLDVFVPGGFKTALARLRAEAALEPERIGRDEVLVEQRNHERELAQLTLSADGGGAKEQQDASAEQLAARRTAIQREIERLGAESDRRERVLIEKRRLIAEQFEREREPYPDGYAQDAGPDADAP